MTYQAMTPGHGDIDPKTGKAASRRVQPSAWLNHCQLRLFIAEDGKKYRVSAIVGTATLVEEDEMDQDGSLEADSE
jgi:hypothetical protein